MLSNPQQTLNPRKLYNESIQLQCHGSTKPFSAAPFL